MKKKTTFSIDENVMNLFITVTNNVNASRSSIIETMIKEKIRMLAKQKEIMLSDLYTNWRGKIFANELSLSPIIDVRKIHNWVGCVGEFKPIPNPEEKIAFVLENGQIKLFDYKNEKDRNRKVSILDIENINE